MIAVLKPYPVYKPSGKKWLGEVPAHWEVRRLKSWLRINDVVLPEDTDPNYAFDYVDIGAVGTGFLTGDLARIRFRSAPSRARRVLRSGDTIVSTVRTYLKAVWSPKDPVENLVASTGFAVLTPPDGTAPQFVAYVCQSDYFADRVTSESVGIAYPAIAETSLGALEVSVPPLSEQAAIARYLDRADERIRRGIQAKEKLVELLVEQRRALINEAVTGRVDVRTGQPYPEYKPSGVEWLGEVPAHWRIARNGQIFIQRNETGFPELPILEVSLNTGVSVRNLDNLDRKQMMTLRSGYKRAIAGDIAYNMMRMWQGAVGVTPVDGLVSPAYVVARPLDGTNPRYFSALFRTSAYTTAVDRSSRGIVKDRNRLYWSDFKQLASPYPPIEEQATIARYLDDSDRRIQRGIQATQRQIDLLKEYRTRLIADVMTGKLDVREAPEALAGDLEGSESITGPGASAAMSGESARSPNVAPQGSDA